MKNYQACKEFRRPQKYFFVNKNIQFHILFPYIYDCQHINMIMCAHVPMNHAKNHNVVFLHRFEHNVSKYVLPVY